MKKLFAKDISRSFFMWVHKSEMMFWVQMSSNLVPSSMELTLSLISWLELLLFGILLDWLRFLLSLSRKIKFSVWANLILRFCLLLYQKMAISLRTTHNGWRFMKSSRRDCSKPSWMRNFAPSVSVLSRNFWKQSRSMPKWSQPQGQS